LNIMKNIVLFFLFLSLALLPQTAQSFAFHHHHRIGATSTYSSSIHGACTSSSNIDHCNRNNGNYYQNFQKRCTTRGGIICASSSSSSPSDLKLSRRTMIQSTIQSLSFFGAASAANADYTILNDEGEYEQIKEEDWQTTWKSRIDKASTMSTDEIFNAARGAGNLDLKNGEEESLASKKRRAMSACRNESVRKQSGVKDAKECNSKVIGGDVDFILGEI